MCDMPRLGEQGGWSRPRLRFMLRGYELMDIRQCTRKEVQELVERYHGYGAVGSTGICWGVYEDDRLVAAYSWLPPPAGAAKAVCAEAPFGVLALSRMVAVPKSERLLKHISKPLKKQMKDLIDRTRWPVLVTYSDEGQGHNGFVYQCSGWTPTHRSKSHFWEDAEGRRQSKYSNGTTRNRPDLIKSKEQRFIQRWEHWVCPKGEARLFMEAAGWERVPLPGKFYTSGNPAYAIRKIGS